MFLKLFFALKAARAPVSLREHPTLIEAMEAGLDAVTKELGR